MFSEGVTCWLTPSLFGQATQHNSSTVYGCVQHICEYNWWYLCVIHVCARLAGWLHACREALLSNGLADEQNDKVDPQGFHERIVDTKVLPQVRPLLNQHPPTNSQPTNHSRTGSWSLHCLACMVR
jgi:hypothetical protein